MIGSIFLEWLNKEETTIDFINETKTENTLPFLVI